MENYPRTGLYREHRDAVHDYGEAIERLIIPEQKMRRLFRSVTGSTEGVTFRDEERQDVERFVRHISKRLPAAAIHSPRGQRRMENGTSKDALRLISLANGHDVWHAVIRYGLSGGKSFVPHFLQAQNEREAWLDPDGLVEETITGLFDDSADAVALARGESIDVSLEPEWFVSVMQELEPLRSSNPLEYFLKAYFAYGIANTSAYLDPESGVTKEELGQAYASLAAEELNPFYIQIATAFFENARKDPTDPRFRLEQFKKILAPLLQDLREKQGANP